MIFFVLECLAVIAQFIGPHNFKPLANESLQFGMRVLKQSSDPDIKKSIYALFAALSIVMKDELSPALPEVINEMIESIQSTEGIIVNTHIFLLLLRSL